MRLPLVTLKDNKNSNWDDYGPAEIIKDTTLAEHTDLFCSQTRKFRKSMYLAIKCVLEGFHMPVMDCDSPGALGESMTWLKRQKNYHTGDIGVIESSPNHFWVLVNWPRLSLPDVASKIMGQCPGNDKSYADMCLKRGFVTLRGARRPEDGGFVPKWHERPKDAELRPGQRDMLGFGDAIVDHLSSPEVELMLLLESTKEEQCSKKRCEELLRQLVAARAKEDVWDDI